MARSVKFFRRFEIGNHRFPFEYVGSASMKKHDIDLPAYERVAKDVFGLEDCEVFASDESRLCGMLFIVASLD